MSVQNWQQVKDIFALVLEQPVERRTDFLSEVCANDVALRVEVESLLEAHAEPDPLIERSGYGVASILNTGGADYEGKELGRYKIIRKIGRGGMGTVYLGRRNDEEYRKFVAVKVVRRGMDTEDIVRRFRTERQILASLDHPNIARLLDGGTTEDGLPYLVMEYVEGTPMTDYCDQHRLTTNERLELFRTVCAAVQHAHQNLVVHRDLKPSNILITTDGTVKLLDFGIAKVLNHELSGLPLERTVTELRVLTPDYASPEQARGEKLTTTSDVYSLGVLLYELLTGHRPYRAGRAPSHELARIILSQEPTKPSTAVTHIEKIQRGDTEPEIAITPEAVSHARDTQPDKLRRRLAGDLDNIVLMALRKEPKRRYESAAQLSEEIRRHMDGLPVIARKDTFKYRATKFVRRNRLGVVTAAVVLLLLLGGIVATLWQAKRATREASIAAEQRDRARIEAAKAERINAFLQSIFASADPNWYSTGHGQRGEVKVVDVLEQAGRRIDAELKDEPEIRAELHHTIGTTYQALGRFEQARTHFRSALDTYRGLYGERHPKVAEALYYLAASISGGGDSAATHALLRQSLELFRAVDPNNTNVPYLLADFAGTSAAAGEMVAAEQAAREGLEMARQRYGDEHVLTLTLISRLGLIYETRGDLRQAETSYQTAFDISIRMPNGRQLSWGWLESLGRISFFKGELKQAEAQYREALDISRQTLNETNPKPIGLLLMLAELHYLQGAYADAEKEAASALDLLRRSSFHNSSYQLRGLSLLSLIHAKTNRRSSAANFLREALTIFNNISDEDRYQDDGLLGEALVVMKREAEARPLLLKRHTFFTRTYGEQNPQAIITRRQLERLDAAPRSP